MSLREDILASPETLSDLAWAAEERFREAEELFSVGRLAGALYLFGLASEMWLKLACFRARWARPSDFVRDQLGPARLWMRINAPGIADEGYHSLRFWAEYLIRVRRMPLPATALGQLRHHVINRLFHDWIIDARYRWLALSGQEVWRVYNDVIWLRDAWNDLWR